MKKKTGTLESINYSFVPNHQDTMEALARAPLNGLDFRLILLVLRQTDGYLRESDQIGPKFLEEKTGLLNEECYRVFKRLKGWSIISSPQPGVYKVNPPAMWQLPTQHPKARPQNPPKRSSPAEVSGAAEVSGLVPQKLAVTPAEVSEIDTPKDNILKTTLETTGADAPQKTKGKKKPEGDPRVAEVMEALETERGWASPCFGGEAGAIKWMLTNSSPPEDILGCWRWLRQDPFWQSTALLMMSVKKQIGIWAQKGRPTTWQPPLSLYTPKTSRIEKLPSPEAFKEGSTW